MKKIFLVFLLLTLPGLLWVAGSGQIDFHASYHTASRMSAHIAPDPKTTTEAVIQVYAARAFNWRGIFAVHTWIAVKPKNAQQYTVYQVIGWRVMAGYPAVFVNNDIPDRYWFNQKPKIVLDVRGEKAEEIIPKIAATAAAYPYPDQYEVWPGPNSNTFVAYMVRQIPELAFALPSDALGKDYLSATTFFAPALSGTGYQFSLWGLLGVTLAVREGLEINILGLVYGINPLTLTFKLPGFGDIKI